MGVGTLTGRLLTGWLLDRFAARVSFALIVVSAIGTFVLAHAGSLAAGAAGAALLGVGMGGSRRHAVHLSRYWAAIVHDVALLTWTACLRGAIGLILMDARLTRPAHAGAARDAGDRPGGRRLAHALRAALRRDTIRSVKPRALIAPLAAGILLRLI
jgi:hypothetical protein